MRTHFFLTHGELTWQYERALRTAEVHSWEPLLWVVGSGHDFHQVNAASPVETRRLDVPEWLEGASPQVLYDCLALLTLYEHGGMTLGLDTISVRDATDLLDGYDLVMGSDWPANRPTEGCEHPYNNHLLAQRGSPILKKMLHAAREAVETGDTRWGATGPLLLTEFSDLPGVGIAPFPTLCGWEGSTIGRFYAGEEPGPDVRVIHLFSSAYPSEYETCRWEPKRTPDGELGFPVKIGQPSKPTLHLLSLPHTQTTRQYLTCAYTQKVVKFCRMMEDHYDVVLYAGEQNEAPCAEHVQLISEAERSGWFGEGFDTALGELHWDDSKPYWRAFNGRAIAELGKRYQSGDLILLCTGTQAIVAKAFPGLATCIEPFVGYEGIATPHCAFESGSFMHTVYAKADIDDGRNYDAVIPNYFDPDEFPEIGDPGGDYLLYVGRILVRKGVLAAVEIAKRAGMRLVVAGPGALKVEPGRIIAKDCVMEGDHLVHVGEVGVEERAQLMAGAYALLAPTMYLEPFGGVAVESMIAGTPALTTDWGAFRETVEQGVTGFRFRTLREALDALDEVPTLDPWEVRERALERFSLAAVRPLFIDWFDRLQTLWGEGWYELGDRETAAPESRVSA